MNILTEASWHALEQAHIQRAQQWTEPYLTRRRAGKTHPVFDFLFEYYPTRAAHLERWHPGIGVGLADPSGSSAQVQWRYYHCQDGITAADGQLFAQQRGETLLFIRDLLEKTASNPAHFDCFGLHEWAMVFQTDSPRHSLPLRLGADGTNQVVVENNLRCTHFDAYRFFTTPARPLNLHVLSRDSQPIFEQKGCLHATMDLYKWGSKLLPMISSQLLLDCFALAWDARILDMAASPYDCREFGISPVCIENKAGKQEYVRRQRELSQRGTTLRQQMITTIDAVLELNLN